MLHLVLFPLFGDHMVLQANRANPLWGWDRPGMSIAAKLERGTVEVARVAVTVGPDGAWRMELPPLPTGGPYRLDVSDGGEQRQATDVLVGEVWLASGQSNMEWPLANTDGAAEEIAQGTNPEIREFKVQRTAAASPAKQVEGQWTVCSAHTAGDFSAVAYYFAKDLQRRLHVPVGIVNSTWGGTRIEAWTPVAALRGAYDVDAELARIAALQPDLPRLKAAYDRKLLAWDTKNFAHDTGISPEAAHWAAPDAEMSAWKPLRLPGYWQHSGLTFNGAVWFRRQVEIPAEWAGKDLVLELGPVDDFDTTYFDGVPVGGIHEDTPNAYEIPRRYVIPARLVKPGAATVAVRVFDWFGDGGFAGAAGDLRLTTAAGGASIPLSGVWRYRVERAIPLVVADWSTYPPPDYPQDQDQPAWLFNGMIAPLIPYGIRGAIWYQGEANADSPRSYRAKFAAMIRDWRTRWGEGQFPFDFVQLANFKADPGWPRLREQQALTLAEPMTGMAVTIDIGDPATIHPRNKREVGRRLALLARAQVYGETTLETSGPTLAAVTISGSEAHVRWTHAEGLRTRDGAAEIRGFEIAGPDGRFVPATARFGSAGEVIVSASAIAAPVSLRYDFQDSPDGNLENAAGLPAVPFRTDG